MLEVAPALEQCYFISISSHHLIITIITTITTIITTIIIFTDLPQLAPTPLDTTTATSIIIISRSSITSIVTIVSIIIAIFTDLPQLTPTPLDLDTR